MKFKALNGTGWESECGTWRICQIGANGSATFEVFRKAGTRWDHIVLRLHSFGAAVDFCERPDAKAFRAIGYGL